MLHRGLPAAETGFLGIIIIIIIATTIATTTTTTATLNWHSSVSSPNSTGPNNQALLTHCIGRLQVPYSCNLFLQALIIVIIIITIIIMSSLATGPFIPGTSTLEPAVIPTAQSSSLTPQHFPYYVWCS